MKRFAIILLLSISFIVKGQYTIHNPYNGVSFDTSFKSALHMHTIESDGDQTVQQRITGDRDAGVPGQVTYYGLVDYNFTILSITDHDSYETAPDEEFSGPGTTWPWHRYSGMTGYSPSAIYIHHVDTSSMYYPDIGNGVLAVRGNELSACQEITGANGYFTHVNSYFSNLGWDDCPVYGGDSLEAYLHAVDSVQGMAIFNHPGRHTAPASFYNNYFDTYGTDVIVGIEIHNYGDFHPVQDPRILWDSINSARNYDDLVWGHSNSDIHQSVGSNDEFRNYNYHYQDTLTEAALRANLISGAFTATYEPNPANGSALTPKLTGVSVSGSTITLSTTGTDSVRWFGAYSDTLTTGSSIDVSNYASTSNFVRAELYNSEGTTYTQPFGIAESTNDIGGDYFVSPRGSDSNPGTDSSSTGAWGTWQKAINEAQAGDTVWFMGGVWYPTTSYNNGNNILWWHAIPGDTTLAGDYEPQVGNSGTAGNPICFFNYPGQTPILDCRNIESTGSFNTAWEITYAHFIHLKGLTVRNVYQKYMNQQAGGIDFYVCSNITVENCVVHDIGGKAFSGEMLTGRYPAITYDTTRFINCDVYNLADSIQLEPFGGVGNSADGWKYNLDTEYIDGDSNPDGVAPVLIFQSCRAWNYSDDGFDPSGIGEVFFDSCWAFNAMDNIVVQDSVRRLAGYRSALTDYDGFTGFYAGDSPYGDTVIWVDSTFTVEGNGFKSGGVSDSITRPTRIYTRCIAANNDGNTNSAGFYDLQYTTHANNSRYYNCLSYHNSIGMYSAGNFAVHPWNLSVFRNIIVFDSQGDSGDGRASELVLGSMPYTVTNSTWLFDGPAYLQEGWPWWIYNDTFNVTNDDFVSLDASQLAGARKEGGYLPDVTFGHLAEGSDLIDAGIQVPTSDQSGVTLLYNDDAPDLGPFEYGTSTPATPSPSRSKYLRSGGKTQVWNGKRQVISF